MNKEEIKEIKSKEESLSDSFYSTNLISLSEENQETKVIEIEVLRCGTIHDHNLVITEKMLSDMEKNYEDDVYGVELQLNSGHNRDGEAHGWIKGLKKKGQSLYALVELTKIGIEKLEEKLYKYVSAEFRELQPHHKNGTMIKNVFIGLALTNVPAMKGQSPIMLSEQIIKLNEYNMQMFTLLLDALASREYVSEEDKGLLSAAFELLTDEEKAEAQEKYDSVLAMSSEEVEEEMKEEEVKMEEEEVKADVQLSEKEVEMIALAEKQQSEINELKEKLAITELSESFDKTMMLSESNTKGFSVESKDEVVGFMHSLAEAQREQFKSIIDKVQTVELGEIGSSKAKNMSQDKTEQIIELSEKLLEEGKAKDIGEAQDMAMRQLDK